MQSQSNSSLIFSLTGALCSFGEEIQTQNFNIYNIKGP